MFAEGHDILARRAARMSLVAFPARPIEADV